MIFIYICWRKFHKNLLEIQKINNKYIADLNEFYDKYQQNYKKLLPQITGTYYSKMDYPRPIKNEQDYESALRSASVYFDNEPATGTKEAIYFEQLVKFIEEYETKFKI